MWTWLLACSGGPTTTTTPGSEGPLVVTGPSLVAGAAVGARQLLVATDRPAALDVTWDDQRRSWPAASAHDVPIVGLGVDRVVDLHITLTSPDGARFAWTQALPIESVPSTLPDVTVFAHDPARAEPGHLIVNVEPPGLIGVVLLFDEQLELAWAWEPEVEVGDIRPWNNGLQVLSGGGVYHLDWLGQLTPILPRTAEPPAPALPADVGVHHEAFRRPDGGWLVLDYESTHVPRYPDALGGSPALVATERALQIGIDGTIERQAAFHELLDLSRVTENGFRTTPRGLDWIHTNGIVEDPRDGGWIVSSRHQSALFEIDRAGEVAWILADPTGWADRFAPLLLQPIGDVTWPDAQHAPQLTDDVLVVFDNRQLSNEPARVVGFRIDEAAGTVEEAFVFDQTATGPERSRALGDADWLPLTGNVLATYGFLDGWGGESAEALGIGRRATALVEWAFDDPDTPVVDLRFSSRDRDGWKAYRAEKLRLPGAR